MFDQLNMTATRIDTRPDWVGDAVHWSIDINGETVEYSEGIGHFMEYGANKLAHEPFKEAILSAETKPIQRNNGDAQWAYKTGVKKGRVKLEGGPHVYRVEVTPPAIEDVLYCLTMDASCVDEGFEDWCNSMDYSTDSIKAKDTYNACTEAFWILRRLGLDLEELQEHFQDY